MWGNIISKIIMTVLISMVPVIELRGAIPIAVANGLELHIAIIASIIGNMIPVPFIILFMRKIFDWLRKKSARWDRLVTKMEKRAEKKAEVVRKSTFWGLAFFVGIPLPGTGAWTGAMIAAVLQMPLKRAIPSIAIGVLMAGLIVSFITYGGAALFFGGAAV